MGLADDEIVAPQAVPDDLVCAICLETFQDPVHCMDSPRPHTYCQQCIFDSLRMVKAECPTCRRPIVASQIVPNTAVQERLSEIVVFCPNRTSGCKWTGRLATREQHRDCCLGEDLRRCWDQLARYRQELIDANMQIIRKENEIGDLKESLAALSDAMRAMQTSNDKQRLEADVQRARQDDLIQDLRTRNASLESQLGALANINGKLRSHNLEIEADLASKMSGLHLTSKGVQCDVTDMSSAHSDIVDVSSTGNSQSHSADVVLEAARQNDLAHLRAILQTYPSVQVNVTTKGEGLSALHLAAQAGHTEAARLLLGSEKFTAVNSHTFAPKRHHSSTALHEAADAGHEGVVKLLLESARFVAASARNSYGGTALHAAAFYGHTGVVGLLLQSHRLKDADVNAVNKAGETALNAAARHADASLALLLLKCPRFQNASTFDVRYHSTALHTAADRGHIAVMVALLESKKFHTAAVNASHSAGYIALHVAVKQGHQQAALALQESLRFTAVTKRCMEGRTAMDIARQRGDNEMISLLLSWPGPRFM